jgi:hypothetical protein
VAAAVATTALEDRDLVGEFKNRLSTKTAEYRQNIKTGKGMTGAIIDAATGIPASIGKVRSAPKKHRPLVALREAGRLYGRIQLGPLWFLGEAITKALRKKRR